jgi:hypothetical protein
VTDKLIGSLVGCIVLDTGMSPREIGRMTWWDLEDINEARRIRAEGTQAGRPASRRPSVASLAAFGGGILAAPPE